MNPTPKPQAPLAVLYGATIFLGAFLLFQLEPLIAKIILPWFGGTAAVWAVCLVFFQGCLLLGYLYADFLVARFSAARQVWIHCALLLVCVCLLPISPDPSWRPAPGGEPAWRILGLLATCIGLPFLLLSSTSPLIQAWYHRRFPAKQPYVLFALSNTASLLALLSFPFLIEPNLASSRQRLLWSALFALFAVLCASAAWFSRWESASTPGAPPFPAGEEKITLGRALKWLAPAAVGSMLLLSITNQLAENVAPIPLLWVLPLALYLVTFILAFNPIPLYSRKAAAFLLPVALGGLGYGVYNPQMTDDTRLIVLFFCAGIFLCCWFCHGELARLRPHGRHLTFYYLMISLGGALGAVAVGLAAPHVFRAIYELPFTLILTALLALWFFWPGRLWVKLFWSAGTAALVWVFWLCASPHGQDVVLLKRNFYAALKVIKDTDSKDRPYLELDNGRIVHGDQYLDPAKRMQPTTYYSHASGIGAALDLAPRGPRRVGVIGLGSGTIATYGRKGDYYHFYDINPQVVDIAQGTFSFLKHCPAQVDITLGDARLSLQAEEPQQFDVLAVDAFSGDAIPVHLLTREAVALYWRHLKPQGVLAIHTSNLYLDLNPVVKLLAEDAGCQARCVSNDDDEDNLVYGSYWVLVTRNQAFLKRIKKGYDLEDIAVPPKLKIWTDDFNNLFQILK
jgi:SAM-dependent methyltransferase